MSAGKLPDKEFVCTIVDITDRKKAEEALLIKDHAISCFRQLKNDPERQSEIDPPLLTQKAVEQINLAQPIVS